MNVLANSFMEQEKLGKLMGRYAIPCIISLLAAALYNIVDQIFIANADYLGSYGNAANTAFFPLTVVALAIAVMIGDGCSAYVGICLDSREARGQQRRECCGAVRCFRLILTMVYLLCSDGILAAFGGWVNEETFHHSWEYFFHSPWACRFICSVRL